MNHEHPKRDDESILPEETPEPGDDAEVHAGGESDIVAPEEEIQNVDRTAIRQFVSEIKSAEQQVGEHIITALSDPSTVAVLTTVVIGPDGGQRIVSAGLDPAMMTEVQRILHEAQKKRVEEVPCVGFHCYVRNKDDAKSDDESESKPES